jgi:hypothetical protein
MERASWLALLPLIATAGFYALPSSFQDRPLIQFLPQLLAYAAFAAWAYLNGNVADRLGLSFGGLRQGFHWGLVTGLSLGTLNSAVILWVVPALGHDIAFLRGTPHAQIPVILMVPWFIVAIALFVEINFRGFLLGRLLALLQQTRFGAGAAIACSALIFSFDPFMVATFKHLHWIAVWDGMIWGALWLHLRTLYATIIAHTVEVIVMYTVIKIALTP